MQRISETATRAKLIDPLLTEAGWNLRDRTQVDFEIRVDGYDKEPWNGVTDYCLYHPAGEVLEYFDAYLVGLTATPNKQTFGFFKQNLVMEYNHEKAVADGVNVNYDVYKIDTEISKGGSRVEKGSYVDERDRLTRKARWEQLDENLAYAPNELDRAAI